jgi:ABC-type transport system substrate-binding protein
MSEENNEAIELSDGLTIKRRDFLALLSGTVAVAALAGPGALLAQARKNGGILRIAGNANPSSMDPATGGSGSDHVFLYPVFDTLVEWDYATLAARPGLAKAWVYPDPKTLVLQLREDVRFHDGELLDAEAVKFNLDRNRSDQRSNIRADLVSVESVEVTGTHEVTLRLKEPDAALPLILSDRAGMMVSPKALQEMGERHDRNPVGTGPMRFVSWEDGNRIVTKRNEAYWKQDRPLVDGIEFLIITDSSTRLRSVMSGQADVAYQLDGRQQQLIERGRGLKGVSGSTIYVFQIYLNHSRGPLQNVKVRQAMNFAIDREAFVRATMGGAGEPAFMNLPKSHWAYDAEVAKLYSYDPERARKLLAEAGYPQGLDLDMRGYTDQASVQRQELLLEMFQQVGIRGRFQNGTIAEASAAFFGQEKAGDLLVSAWTGRPDPSLSYSLMYLEQAYFNAGRVTPPEGFVEALGRSRSTDDIDQRRQALSEVQRLVMENALVVPLAFRDDILAYGPRVRNLQANLLGKPKFEDVQLEG